MSECYYKLDEFATVGREWVQDLPTPVCFVQETGINELLSMFGNRFEIAIQLFRDGVQRQIVFFAQQKKGCQSASDWPRP